jgi:hypothetical protein
LADWTRAPKLSLYPREHEGQGRAYKDPITGEQYPSVTSVLKYEDKSSLIQWAVDRAVLWCVENWQELGADPDVAFSRARRRHNDVRDERAWVGTGVHAYIEAEHTNSWDVPELDAEQLEILEWWKHFNDIYLVEPILSEWTVVNRKVGYAGTADGLWRITDKLTGESWVSLIDVKTSKRIWDGHLMQLSALANAEYYFEEVSCADDSSNGQKWKNTESGKFETACWVEHKLPKFDKVQVLHLTAEGVTLVDVNDIDVHFKKFCAYKTILDADQELKQRKKEDKNV